jgi:hypothetical protein
MILGISPFEASVSGQRYLGNFSEKIGVVE